MQVWHARYIMLLWLSLICLLPFDLAVLDSGGEESDAHKILRVAKVSHVFFLPNGLRMELLNGRGLN